MTKPLKTTEEYDLQKAEELEVYEGEIIDNDTEKTAVEKQENKPPARTFAYKLGIFTGSLLSLVGLISEAGRLFKSDKGRAAGMNKGPGRNRRRRKGKRCSNR
jgi:hypothetical protein